MTETVLTIDVYVSPLRPYAGSPAQGPGDDPNWSPMSSTLIAGEEEAILVDALIANEQVDALAEWVRGFGKRLTGVYITHGHTDHWGGLAPPAGALPGSPRVRDCRSRGPSAVRGH
jgi:glyoxylase-like metal-dependent hydrolase (beta-lactamase superfamily II)